MTTYHFKTAHSFGIIADDQAGKVSYEVGRFTYFLSSWGGVMDVSIARYLKPWATPVPLEFTSYRIGQGEWIEIEDNLRIWGCLLRGPGTAGVTFALIENGWPMIGKSRYGGKNL